MRSFRLPSRAFHHLNLSLWTVLSEWVWTNKHKYQDSFLFVFSQKKTGWDPLATPKESGHCQGMSCKMLSPQQASLYSALAIFFLAGKIKSDKQSQDRLNHNNRLFNLIRDCKHNKQARYIFAVQRNSSFSMHVEIIHIINTSFTRLGVHRILLAWLMAVPSSFAPGSVYFKTLSYFFIF